MPSDERSQLPSCIMAIGKDKPVLPELGIVDDFAHIWFMQIQKKINVLGLVKKHEH
jgi:hypothetical protein